MAMFSVVFAIVASGSTCQVNFTNVRHKHGLKAFYSAGGNAQRLFYRPHEWLLPGSTATIVDIGSFEGVDLARFMNLGIPPAVQIHTFEPVPATRELLLGNVQRYSQIHVHAFGLGNHNHSACVVGAGSAQKMVEVTKTPRQGARTACTVDAPRVQIVDAVHALEQLHTPITFLQINCEGCEQYVLERLIEFPALARTVHTIEVQFHCGAVKKDTY